MRTIPLLLLAAAVSYVDAQPGEVCTFLQRYCLPEATCNPVTNKCDCPPGTKGNGLFACVPIAGHVCESTADPHITTFANGRGSFPLPCRHRLARFITPHSNPVPPERTHCFFTVLGINTLVSWGRFFEEELEIILGVGQIQTVGPPLVTEDKITFHLTRDALFYKLAEEGTNEEANPYEEPVNIAWRGIDINVFYISDQRFVILNFPQCGTQVKFRAFVPNERPQRLLPGISVEAPETATFGVDRLSLFPYSLCMTPSDLSDLNIYAEDEWLNCPTQLLVWAQLTAGPKQTKGPYKVECENAQWIFSKCTSHMARANAIKNCTAIMARFRATRCLFKLPRSISPMMVFNVCLRYFCVDVAAACREFKVYLSRCPRLRHLRRLECPSPNPRLA